MAKNKYDHLVVEGDSVSEYNIQRFFKFMIERHSIYLKRRQGAKFPWTEDPILGEYKFTNVFRELDTGTVWYREHIREPGRYIPQLFFHTCAYRMINYYPTYQDVIDKLGLFEEFNADAFAGVLNERKLHKLSVFTSAHMLAGKRGKSKIDFIVRDGLQYVWDNRKTLEPHYSDTTCDTLEQTFKNLLAAKIPSVGPFIAYEIVTDLRHTRYLDKALDVMEWANPGPGARRGINRIYNIPLNNRLSELVYIHIMQYILMCAAFQLPNIIEDFENLEMRDIEHSLCEFDKYERVRLGQGRPRQKYKLKQV